MMDTETGKLRIAEIAKRIAAELDCQVETAWVADQRRPRGTQAILAANSPEPAGTQKTDALCSTWVLELRRTDTGTRVRAEFGSDQISEAIDGSGVQIEDRLRSTILRLFSGSLKPSAASFTPPPPRRWDIPSVGNGIASIQKEAVKLTNGRAAPQNGNGKVKLPSD